MYYAFLWFGLLFSPLCHHHGIMVTKLRREARIKGTSQLPCFLPDCLCSHKWSFSHQFCTFLNKEPKCEFKERGVRAATGGERGVLLLSMPGHTQNKWCVVRHYCAISPTPHINWQGHTRENTFQCMIQHLRRRRWMTDRFAQESFFEEGCSHLVMEMVYGCQNVIKKSEFNDSVTSLRNSSAACFDVFCSLPGQRGLREGGWSHRDGSHHLGGEDERLQDWPVRTQQGGTCRFLQLGKLLYTWSGVWACEVMFVCITPQILHSKVREMWACPSHGAHSSSLLQATLAANRVTHLNLWPNPWQCGLLWVV